MTEVIEVKTISMDAEEIEKVTSLKVMKTNAENAKVEDNFQYAMAGEFLTRISVRINELEAIRKKLKAPILEAGRNVDDLFRRPIQQGKEARRDLQTKMLKYTTRIKEEERQAEVEAAKKIDEQKEDAEQKAMDEMEAGNEEAAQEILDNIDVMPVPAQLIEQPKAPGVSTRVNWQCRLINLNKLNQAISKGQAPLSLIQLDTVAANKYAKAVRDTMTIPGLEFYNDETLAVRTK